MVIEVLYKSFRYEKFDSSAQTNLKISLIRDIIRILIMHFWYFTLRMELFIWKRPLWIVMQPYQKKELPLEFAEYRVT